MCEAARKREQNRADDLRGDLRRLRADCDKAVRDYWKLVEAADAAGFDCVRLEAKADRAESGQE